MRRPGRRYARPSAAPCGPELCHNTRSPLAQNFLSETLHSAPRTTTKTPARMARKNGCTTTDQRAAHMHRLSRKAHLGVAVGLVVKSEVEMDQLWTVRWVTGASGVPKGRHRILDGWADLIDREEAARINCGDPFMVDPNHQVDARLSRFFGRSPSRSWRNRRSFRTPTTTECSSTFCGCAASIGTQRIGTICSISRTGAAGHTTTRSESVARSGTGNCPPCNACMGGPQSGKFCG
jgi:hypothetical protein